jgi:putative ABC transport system permease protein
MVEFLSARTKAGNDLQSIVFGWLPGTFQFEKLTLQNGRLLQTGDDKVAILGSVMAKNLGKDVGDDIELLDEKFKVVGVFSTFNTFENGGIVLPLHAMQKLLLRRNSVSGFAVIVDNTANIPIEKLCQQIEEIRLETNNIRMQARPTQEYVDSSVHIQIIHVAALLNALIAIASGIISTLNTMSMAVFERFREIGTLRAIGWSKSRIVRMVIGESIVLGIGGAALGIATSLILLRVLSILPETSGFIDGGLPLFVIAQGFLVAILVGVVGGLLPAYRAARLLPTEALRYE